MPVSRSFISQRSTAREAAEAAAARTDFDGLLEEQRSTAFPELRGIFRLIEENEQALGSFDLQASNLSPEEAAAFDRMQRAQPVTRNLDELNMTDDQMLLTLVDGAKAGLVEQFGLNNNFLSDDALLSIIEQSGAMTMDELYASLSGTNLQIWKNRIAPNWSKMTPHEQAVKWESLSEEERQVLATSGLAPPGSDLRSQALAYGVYGLTRAMDSSLIGGALRWMEDRERDVSRLFAGAREANDFGVYDAVQEDAEPGGASRFSRVVSQGLTETFIRPFTQGDDAQAQRAEDAGAGILDEFMATVSSVALMALGGRGAHYWKLGGEVSGEDKFLPNVQERAFEQAGINDASTIESVLGIAAAVPSGSINAALESEDPEEAIRSVYLSGLEAWLEETMPGVGAEEVQARAQVYAAFAENDRARQAVTTLTSEGRVSWGRNAAMRAGYVPGDAGYNSISGAGDAVKAFVFDPFLAAGKAAKTVRAARWGIEASDGTVRAGRIARMMDRRAFGRVADDVTGAIREQVEAELNTMVRLVDRQAIDGMSVDDIIEEYMGLGLDIGVDRNFGLERIARNQPAMYQQSRDILESMRTNVVRDWMRATSSGTVKTDTIRGTVNRVRLVGNDVVVEADRGRGLLSRDVPDAVEAVTEEVRGVEIAKLADDGTWRVTEDAIGPDALKHYILREDGLSQITHGRAGGVLLNTPMLPHDTLWQLPFKGAKRRAALAIDWLNDSHTTIARKMVEGGHISEEAADELGLLITQSGRRSGTTMELLDTMIEEGTASLTGVGMAWARAAAASRFNPLTAGGRLVYSMANLSHNGALNLANGQSDVFMRQYLSMVPTDMRSRMMAQWMSATTPGAKLRIGRSIITEIMDRAAITETRAGKRFYDDVMQRWDAMHGYANIGDGATETLDWMYDGSVLGGAKRALDTNDLAGAMYLPDVRQFYRVISMAEGWKKVGAPVDLIFGSGAMDWFHGQMWNRFTLLKPAFAFRASADELGIAMIREGVLPLMAGRAAFNVATEGRVLPRFLSPHHFLLRSHLKRSQHYSYENVVRAMVDNGTLQTQNTDELVDGMKLLDEIYDAKKGPVRSAALQRLRDLPDRKQAEIAATADMYRKYMSNENPFKIISQVRSETDSRYVRYIMEHRGGDYRNLLDRAARGVVKFVAPGSMVDDVHRMMAYDADATRYGDARMTDMTAVAQGVHWQNPSAQAGGAFNMGQGTRDPIERNTRIVIDQIQRQLRDTEGGNFDVIDPQYIDSLIANWNRKLDGAIGYAVTEEAAEIMRDLTSHRMTYDEFIDTLRTNLRSRFTDDPEIQSQLGMFERHAFMPDGRPVKSRSFLEMAHRLKGSKQADDISRSVARRFPDDPSDGMPPTGPTPQGPPPDAPGPSSPSMVDMPEFESGRGDLLTERPRTVGSPGDRVYHSLVREQLDELEVQIEEIERAIAVAGDDASDAARQQLDKLRDIHAYYSAGTTDERLGRQVVRSIALSQGVSPQVWDDMGEAVVDPRNRDYLFRMMFGDAQRRLTAAVGRRHANDLLTALGVFDGVTGEVDPIGLLRFHTVAEGSVRDVSRSGLLNTGAIDPSRLSRDQSWDEVIDLYVEQNIDDLRVSMIDNLEDRKQLVARLGGDPEQVALDETGIVDLEVEDFAREVKMLFRNHSVDGTAATNHGIDLFTPQGIDAFDSMVASHLDTILPGRGVDMTGDRFLGVIMRSDDALAEVLARNADGLAEFQSMVSPRNVAVLRRAWSLMRHQQDAAYRTGKIPNSEVGQAITRVSRAMGVPESEFVLTPLHYELLVNGIEEVMEATMPSVARGERLTRAYAKGRIRDAASMRLLPNEVAGALAVSEGQLFRLVSDATDPRNQQQVVRAFDDFAGGIDEMLTEHGVPLDGEGILDHVDTLTVKEYDDLVAMLMTDSLQRGGFYNRFGVQRADELWEDVRNDEEFIDYLRTISGPHTPSNRAVVTPRDLQSMATGSADDAATTRFLGAVVEHTGDMDVDLLRMDQSELFGILSDLRAQDLLDDKQFADLGMLLDSLSTHTRLRQLSEMGMPPDLPAAMTRMLDVVKRDGGIDSTPEWLWMVGRYTEFKSMQVRDPDGWRQVMGGIDGAEKGVYGRWTASPTQRELDEIGPMASAMYADNGPPGGPPPMGPPPPRGDDYDDGAEMAWMAQNAFASDEEAVIDHVDRSIRAWEEQFMADPTGLADEFALGTVPPQEGNAYALVQLDSTGKVKKVRLTETDELSSLPPGVVMAEVPVGGDLDALTGVPLEELDVRVFNKPITTRDMRVTEADTMDVLDELRLESELAGAGFDEVNDPRTLNDVLRQAQVLRADGNEQGWLAFTGGIMRRVKSERARKTLSQLFDGDGVDPAAMRRTINDDLIEKMLRNKEAGRLPATIEDIDGSVIRPKMLPKETYAGELRREGGSGLDAVNEMINRVWEKGFGEWLLPWVDNLSRHPMITNYYTDATDYIRRGIRERMRTTQARSDFFYDQIETRRLTPDSADDAARDARALASSEDFDSIDQAVTLEYKQRVAASRSEWLDGPKEGKYVPEAPGLNWRTKDPEKLRALTQATAPYWLRRHLDEASPQERDVIAKVIARHLEDTSDMTDAEILADESLLTRALDRGINQAIDIERRIDGKAKSYAYSKMMAFTDMDSTGSLFAMKFRNLFPFWWAEERFIKRLATSFYHSPDRFRTAQLTYKGIDSYGYIEEDEDGEKIFVYPFGNMANQIMSRTLGLVYGNPEEWKIPGLDRTTGRFIWAAPGLDTHGVPQPGPIAAIKLHMLTDRFPELQPVKRALLPEIAENPNRSVFEFTAPSTVRKFLDIPDSHERYASQMFMAAAALTAAGLSPLDPDDPDAPPPTTEELELFNARLENYTRILAIENAVYGLVGLAPPQIEIEDTAKQQELMELMTLLGFEDAIPEFMRRNPDIDPITMFSTESSSGGPLPATESVGRYIEEHHGWFSSDLGRATATHFIRPEATDDEMSSRVFAQMNFMGLRNARSDFAGPEGIIDEVVDELMFQQAAPEFFRMKNAYDTLREEVKGTPMAPDLDNEWKQWRNGFESRNPTFAAVLNGKVEDPTLRLVQLEEALGNPNAPRNEKVDKIEVLVRNWRRVRDQIDELSGYSGRSEPSAALENLRSNFVQWGYEHVVDDPANLSYVWESMILPELGYSRSEALEIAGIDTISQMVSPNVRSNTP